MSNNESVVPNEVAASREPNTTQSELVPERFKKNKELPSTFFNFGKGPELTIGSEPFLSFFVNVKLKLITPFAGRKCEDPESGSLKLWEEFEDVHAAPLHQVPVKDKVAAFRLCLKGEALKSVTAFPYPTNNLGYLELIEYFFVRYGGVDSECYRLFKLASRAVPRSLTDRGYVRFLEWLVGTCKLWTKYAGPEGTIFPLMISPRIYVALPKDRVANFLCDKVRLPGVDEEMTGHQYLDKDPALGFQAALYYLASLRTRWVSLFSQSPEEYEDDSDEDEGPVVVFVREESQVEENSEKKTNSGVQCKFCFDVDHNVFSCPMSVEDKREIVANNGLCLNCLKKGHHVRACRNKMRCKIDGGKHHTSVCYDQ